MIRVSDSEVLVWVAGERRLVVFPAPTPVPSGVVAVPLWSPVRGVTS